MRIPHKSQYANFAYDKINSVIDSMYVRIRQLREDRDLTQSQLASYLHVNQTTYSRYETGVLDIPTGMLKKLSALYGVSIDYILEIEN